MKYFSVITLFPEFIRSYGHTGIIGRAVRNRLIEIETVNPRKFAPRERHVDDAPYGGGPGMVMMIEPIVNSIQYAKSLVEKTCHVINLVPHGNTFKQTDVKELLSFDHLILVAGRYEGIDERISHYVDREYSVGDFVLSGGEIPAILLIDVISRNIPGVLGEPSSLEKESYNDGMLDFPQYTRPSVFDGYSVPEILLSGDHKEIANWRKKERLGRTKLKRPDLFRFLNLTDGDLDLVRQYLDDHKEKPKD